MTSRREPARIWVPVLGWIVHARDIAVSQWSVNKSRPSGAKFCPFCGSDKIERDGDKPKHIQNGADYICATCCAGWRMLQSPRVQKTLALFAEHRRCRDGFWLDGPIPKEIADIWDQVARKQVVIRQRP